MKRFVSFQEMVFEPTVWKVNEKDAGQVWITNTEQFLDKVCTRGLKGPLGTNYYLPLAVCTDVVSDSDSPVIYWIHPHFHACVSFLQL